MQEGLAAAAAELVQFVVEAVDSWGSVEVESSLELRIVQEGFAASGRAAALELAAASSAFAVVPVNPAASSFAADSEGRQVAAADLFQAGESFQVAYLASKLLKHKED